jgi:8-oxo-dGTP diphosphatase
MEKNPTTLFVVAAALTNQSGAILLQKRPDHVSMGGLWEFPGGKVEAGESPEVALARELFEELGISVNPQDLIPETFASEPLGDRHLLLLLYLVMEHLCLICRFIVQIRPLCYIVIQASYLLCFG